MYWLIGSKVQVCIPVSSFKSMGGVKIKKSEALEVLSMKIQCDVRCNRYIFQLLGFLRRGKIFWSVPQYLLWDFSSMCRRGRNCSFITIMSPTLLIHWSIVAMWLVLHYSIAIRTDFNRAKWANIFLRIISCIPT